MCKAAGASPRPSLLALPGLGVSPKHSGGAASREARARRPSYVGRSRLQQRHRTELLAEDRLARRLEPLLQHRGVDAAEVDGVFQIALVEIRQRRVIAED